MDALFAPFLANPTLADGTALFHADHGNLDATALSLASLGTGVSGMLKQAVAGRNINARPAFLLSSPELDVPARDIIRQVTPVGTPPDQVIRVISNNRFVSVTDPLSGSAHTGSATTWFLAARGDRIPGLVIVYPETTGRDPQVMAFDLNEPGKFGIGISVKFDFGVGVVAHHGLYKGNG